MFKVINLFEVKLQQSIDEEEVVDSLSLISAMYLLRSGWVLSVIGDCVTDLYRVMCGVCGVQIRKYSDLLPQIDPSVKLYNHGEGPY